MVIPRRLLKGVALLPLILTVAMVAHSPTEAASFTDVTSAAGLSGVLGFRCAVADINGDGYPDLLLHRQSFFDTGDVLSKQYVYLNVPGDNPGDPHSRKFVDRTAESGVRATRSGASSGHQSDGVVLADVDNDGDLDAFFFTYVHQTWTLTGKNDLMLNDGQGHFTYATNSPFHLEPVYNTTDGAWLDYDNDGNIDLAISNWYWNNLPTYEQLYRGQGNGGFTNVTGPSGIGARASVTYALSTFDWNNDGWMDLFVPLYDYLNTALTCLHWRNNGNGTFTQVQDTSQYNANCGVLKQSLVASFGSMPRDYDNDGRVDFNEIFVHGGTDRGKFSGPVKNLDGVFSWDWGRVKDRGTEDPNTRHDGDHQASWWDYDGDMLSDYVLTECFYDFNKLYLFKQYPDHTFHPATVQAGLDGANATGQAIYDVIPLDYDGDGDEDLLVGFADNSTSVQLWRNDVGTLNRWTSITLEGGGSPLQANTAGIGARIEVIAGGVTQTREVYAGIGQHAPQAPLTQTIGLGQATMIDSIRVRWPNQTLTSSEWKYVPVNTFLRIREVCTPPADPVNLTVAKEAPDVVLTWDDPGIAGLSWKVYRGIQPDHSAWGAPREVGVTDQDPAAPGIQYRDSGAGSDPSTSYYLVTAFSTECGESAVP